MLRALVLLISVLVAVATPASAQDGTAPAAVPALVDDPLEAALPDEAGLQVRIDAVAADSSLAPEVRERVLALLEPGRAHIAAAAASAARIAELEALTAAAPAKLQEIRAQLATPPAVPVLPPPGTATLAELEASLRQAEQEASAAAQNAEDWEAERRHRADRRTRLPDLLKGMRQRLDEPVAAAVAGEAPAEADARVLVDRLLRQSLRKEIEAGQAELTSYDARADLLTARLDLAARRVQETRAAVEAWSTRLSDRRRRDAEAAAQAAQEAERALAGQHEIIQAVARENTALTAEREALQDRLDDDAQALTEARAQAEVIVSRHRTVRDKVQAAGFTDAVALLLRRHRAELPDLQGLRDALRARQRVVADTQLALLDRSEERAALQLGLEDRVAELLAPVADDEALSARLRPVLVELLEARRTELEKLVADLDRSTVLLVDLDVAERDLLTQSTAYAEYIDENVLWVRSARPLAMDDVEHLAEGLAWLLEPTAWAATAQGFVTALGRDPWRELVLGLLLVMLVATRRSTGRAITAIGERVSATRVPAMLDTMRVLALSLWRAALLPAVAWFFGDRLATLDEPVLAQVLGRGLAAAATVAVPLSLLIRLTRLKGLGDIHLRWPTDVLTALRPRLRLITIVLLPSLAITVGIQEHPSPEIRDVVGRVALIVTLAVLTALTWITFGSGAPLSKAMQRGPDGWILRLRPVWWPIAALTPPVLAVGTALGWDYMGRELGTRLLDTWLLVLLLVIGHGLVLRWLFLEQRRLRLEQARRRREAVQADAIQGEVETTLDIQDELDTRLISQRARQVLRTAVAAVFLVACWLIWSDVLPALGALDQVELWEVEESVAPEMSMPPSLLGAAPGPSAESVVRRMPISLADVLGALLLIGVTLGAARNIPALLEILVLSRLRLEPGSGYAISTVIRYLITVIGIVWAGALVGISWNKVQWLAAAITVGLGFGLQEIFANFVSGLIILFEKPVRVGDIVTVGNIEGVVTRIRIRATTIRDWDRRELLVPNREFITAQLINWTLTDPITRVVLPVGVAYGSDTKQVTEILLAAARAQPVVLDDPAPSVVFRNFGDSSLNFQLRIFIGNRDHWAVVTHGLNTAINDDLARAGITIPFPQRDVHVRTYGRGDDALAPSRVDAPAVGARARD